MATKVVKGLAARPPKVKGRVANDVASTAPRSAMMPMPTTDTTYQTVSRKIFPQSLNQTPPKAKIPKTRMGPVGTKSPSMGKNTKFR